MLKFKNVASGNICHMAQAVSESIINIQQLFLIVSSYWTVVKPHPIRAASDLAKSSKLLHSAAFSLWNKSRLTVWVQHVYMHTHAPSFLSYCVWMYFLLSIYSDIIFIIASVRLSFQWVAHNCMICLLTLVQKQFSHAADSKFVWVLKLVYSAFLRPLWNQDMMLA